MMDHNVVYATCGIISKHGTALYMHKPITAESETVRQTDGLRADALFDHLLFANIIDNFNCYLTDILTEILRKDPRPVYGRKLDFKLLYAVSDLDQLKRDALERYIVELGYQNITDLSDFLVKNFGLMSLNSWLTRLRLNRLIQMRNLIAHNRGLVNPTYLYKSGAKRQKINDRVDVRMPLHSAKYLSNLAEVIDREAVGKFNLNA